jgi:hypothetical protein
VNLACCRETTLLSMMKVEGSLRPKTTLVARRTRTTETSPAEYTSKVLCDGSAGGSERCRTAVSVVKLSGGLEDGGESGDTGSASEHVDFSAGWQDGGCDAGIHSVK